MAGLTSQHIFEVIFKATGQASTTAQMLQYQALVNKLSKGGLEINSLKLASKDAKDLEGALVQATSAATGLKTTLKASFEPKFGAIPSPTSPSGFIWSPGVGMFRDAKGRFAAATSPTIASKASGGMFRDVKGRFVSPTNPSVSEFPTGPQTAEAPLLAYSAALKTVAVSTGTAAKASENFLVQQGKLAARALVVVPIWMLMRSAIMALVNTVSSGVNSIVKLDEALLNVKNELSGSTKDLEGFMGRLKEQAVSLATETGVSVEKVVESFRMFATAGIDAETSMAGMNTAVKGSVATMGDSVETARLLADIYNQFGDRITEVSGAQNKFNYIMSTAAALMPTNVFTMQEFNGALTNFLGTAKAANLTLDQTFTLVAVGATLMQRGARGGTQLTSAFEQLTVKTKEIERFLGVLPEGISRFETFMAIIKKAADISQRGGALPEDIAEIFGLRGGRIVKADIAGFTKLVDELERLNQLTPNERMAFLVERYGTALEKINVQIGRFGELRDNLVRLFLQGAAGGNTFAEALKNINEQLEKMAPAAKRAGEVLHTAFWFMGQGATDLDFEKKPSQIRGMDLWRMVNPKNIGDAIGISMDLADVSDALALQESETAQLELRKQIMKQRQKAGLSILAPGIVDTTPIGGIGGSGVTPIDTARTYTLDQQVKLMEQMKALGYNELQIEQMKYEYIKKNTTDRDALLKAEIDMMGALNKEVLEFSTKLQSTFQGGLSDILMGKGTLSDFTTNVGNAFRQGLADAVTGNITDQLFQSSGIGNMFGGIFSNIRHGGDKTKISADYFHDKIKAVADYFAERLGTGGGTGIAGGLFGAGGFSGGGLMTLPGFGTGGWMNTPVIGPTYGNLTATGSRYGTSTYTPYQGRSGATPSQLLAVGGSAAMSGMAGAQGPGGMVSGIMGGVGAGMMGAAALGIGQGISVGGTMVGAALPWLGPAGLVLAIGAMIYGMLQSPPKWSQTQTSESTKQIGSRIDITNKQLEWVNRNLVGMRQELSYVMQESFYFRQRPIEEGFAIDSMRGSA